MSSSAAASAYWRVAGMTYLKYANLCADMVRSALKEPLRTKAKGRETVYFRSANWKDGKPQTQGEELLEWHNSREIRFPSLHMSTWTALVERDMDFTVHPVLAMVLLSTDLTTQFTCMQFPRSLPLKFLHHKSTILSMPVRSWVSLLVAYPFSRQWPYCYLVNNELQRLLCGPCPILL